MKKLLLFPFVMVMFLLSGCLGDPVQDDLLNYLNEEIDDVADLEAEALDAYDSVTGANYVDDYLLYDTLSYTVIPVYQEFVSELEAIDVETDELREIHETYIEGANTQYNAFVKIMTAIEEQDPNKIEEANLMLDDARKLLRDFNNDIENLAEEHNVEITDSFEGESF